MHHGGVWQEQLHVPLLIRVPGLGPQRITRLISVADVVPTLLGLIALPAKEKFLRQASGIDRLAGEPSETFIFSQESAAPWKTHAGKRSPRYMLTGDEWKLIHDPSGQDLLFRLTTDPFEFRNVRDDYPDVAGRLRSEVLARIERQIQRRGALRPLDSDSRRGPNEKVIEQLRSLGYLN